MNKTIVITGGAKGLGKAIAQKFASEGFNLALCGRTLKDLETFKLTLQNQYPAIDIFIKSVDLTNKSAAIDFAKTVILHFGDIDVLVNNTGTYVGGEISTEPDGTLEHLIETNLYSAYYVSRAFLPTFLQKNEGHIFNMCSVASKIAYPNGGSYSISKFALLGFSKCLREELKDKGIKVTSILPGATWSDSWAGVSLPEDRIMPASDIGAVIWGAYNLSKVAVVEELVVRPQLGDL